MAKNFLDKAGIAYNVVDAEEQRDLTKKYGIMQAPTLVVVDGNEVEKFANASNIKKFAEKK